ncbi:DUF2946 domain-containing protein [Rhizobium sp. BK068]|uniref:DUF2946 domain-containing protein n=1 Tax=Rhizobium sp. BK068 TaxID=2512130 RepID=UPI0010D782ED|nr:DUF2946 domain-containing protein [Rhizobium sp. BK068]TCM69278.1 DUF2946 family protein [Rhizobium sp. BK068]
MRGDRRRRAAWLVIFAAYLFVLQSLFAAAESGAAAATLGRDAFGNIICTSSGGERHQQGEIPSHSSHGQDCCTLGCTMFAPTIGSPPDLTSLPAKLSRDAGSSVRARRVTVLREPDYSPANPRAPPHRG